MSDEIRRRDRAGSEFLIVPPGPEQGGGPRSRIHSRRRTLPHHLADAARDPSRRTPPRATNGDIHLRVGRGRILPASFGHWSANAGNEEDSR